MRGLRHTSRHPNVLSLSRHVPSLSGSAARRVALKRGAEAPGQRTARGRLLRRVMPPTRRRLQRRTVSGVVGVPDAIAYRLLLVPDVADVAVCCVCQRISTGINELSMSVPGSSIAEA